MTANKICATVVRLLLSKPVGGAVGMEKENALKPHWKILLRMQKSFLNWEPYDGNRKTLVAQKHTVSRARLDFEKTSVCPPQKNLDE
jgi:hypothetical protein